jgi:predicted DNA-binding protein (UPF0251 family)
MSIKILHRQYVPGIGRDAKKLGVSRQFLSRVLNNLDKYGHYQIYRDYKDLKQREAAEVSG